MSDSNSKRKRKFSEASEIVDECLSQQDKRILDVRKLMFERETARKEGNFDRSDSIRDQLKNMGVLVQDQSNGPSGWRFLDGSTKKLSKPKVGNMLSNIDSKSKSIKVTTNSADDDVKESKLSEKFRNKALVESVLRQNSSEKREGVSILDVLLGDGKTAVLGSRVKVNYIGRLKSNNKVFDSSKKPFSFKIGQGEVIRGWDVGIVGMRVGGKRKLTIPPEKAYGKKGAPPVIPGNATLEFDVSLVEVK